jgi:epoxyqueuosine reductase QueG
MTSPEHIRSVSQLSADLLKSICLESGADDAGFVEIGREALASELKDILRVYPRTRTVVSIVKLLNRESVQSAAVNIANEEFHRACDDLPGIARKILLRLNALGIRGLYIPYAFPSDMNRWTGKIWDISHKLVAVEAGLGRMGLHRLVIHPRHGNFMVLTTLLIDAELDHYRRPVSDNPCIQCNLCAAVCPVGAIHKDRQFDFLACFTHSYRETLAGFQDWVEKIVSSRDIKTYRARFRDSETLSVWQALTYGHSYKCSYCLAVCPAGNDLSDNYSSRKKAYFDETVAPLIHRREPVYVIEGTRAEVAVRKNPDKEVRLARTPLRPTSIANFLMGVRLAFNPEKAKGVRMTLHFFFTGKEEIIATVVIDGESVAVNEGAVGRPDLVVSADSESWIKFLNEELSLFKAIVSRKLRIRGNPLLMKRFQNCLIL